jgi:hypothetical protein
MTWPWVFVIVSLFMFIAVMCCVSIAWFAVKWIREFGENILTELEVQSIMKQNAKQGEDQTEDEEEYYDED